MKWSYYIIITISIVNVDIYFVLNCFNLKYIHNYQFTLRIQSSPSSIEYINNSIEIQYYML